MAKRKTAKAKTVDKVAPAESVQVSSTLAAPRIHGPVKAVAPEFNILTQSEEGRARQVQAHLLDLSARRSSNPRPATFAQASTVQLKQLPFPHFLMQWHADSFGYPASGLVNFVGDAGCGKTTKALSDAGHIMLERNSPVLYMSCEGKDKTMSRDRMLRCMHSDPLTALKLLDNVSIEYTKSVLQLMPQLTNWAKVQRQGVPGKGGIAGIPMDIPLIAIVDPFSRLMNAMESQGNIEWDKVGKEQRHEPGTAKMNLGHAKFASDFCRWLQGFVDEFNVLLFLCHSRTEDVDTSGAAARATQGMSEWKSKLVRYKFIGGSAFESLASMTYIMTSTETIKHPIKKIITGRRVRCRLKKQSHGVGERFCSWELRMEHGEFDTPEYLDPPIQYSEGLCDMLQEQKLLGTRIGDDGLVTVADLGFRGLTPRHVDNYLHGHPELLTQLGRQLNINGYVNIVDEIIAAVKAAKEAKKEKKDGKEA